MSKYLNIFLPFDSRRDALLDVCKGVAIILVVLGHTFQGAHSNFDEFFGFTFIYSFHMPLFTLLSGASAAFWIGKIDFENDYESIVKSLFIRSKKASLHLLVPFASWGVFSYFYSHSNKDFLSYAVKLLKQPDYGLWFLPLIFWCTVLTCVFMFIIFSFYRITKSSPKLMKYSKWLLSINTQVVLMYILWTLTKPFMPHIGGLPFANYFHGGLFFYFLAGILGYRLFTETKSYIVRFIPYMIFFSLVSFWDRLGVYNISPDATLLLAQHWFVKYYSLTVALTGSLVFIDISRNVVALNIDIITRIISLLGIASLAIYALHTYLLWLTPALIAPLVVSVVIFRISGIVPLVKKLFFG